MKKFKQTFLILALTLSVFTGDSQTINIHSIDDDRMQAGDNGYTLNGQHMRSSSTAKLTDTTNFGPTGMYPKSVTITNGYLTSG